jgi:hypothetical protein
METQEKIYHIYFDPELNSVVMEWDGYATSRQFRDGTELMLDTLISNNTHKVLADIRNMTLIGMEDQHWLEHAFLPRAIGSGFRAIAILRPKHYFNKVAVESVSYKVDRKKLNITFFDNIAEAREWLKQQL